MEVLSWAAAQVAANPSILPTTATAVGVVVGASQFVISARRERKRKTLELCERFILDPANEERWERLALALEADAFPLDTEPPAAGSLRFDVSRLLNQLETACAGVNGGFYARSVVASYLEDHAALLHDHFLRQDPPPLTSSRFHRSAFVELRRAFVRPAFREEPALASAARLAVGLHVRLAAAGAGLAPPALPRAGDGDPGGHARAIEAFAAAVEPHDRRGAHRLRFLLAEGRRREATPPPDAAGA